MAQVVRWYLMPLEERPLGSGRWQPLQALRVLLQGRWTYYRLPDNWALVRVRGQDTQHGILEGRSELHPWPRGRGQRWNAASSVALRQRLQALGVTITGNPFADEVLDQVGQAHQDWLSSQVGQPAYATAWNRTRERRSDEATLGAVEEV